ncbi:MAG: hypothetical protein HKN25_02445 [Pyrinomonadaceae bacterium]|nr:hypothetical protein [Pyrinomonadaceae bacterium]
MKKFSIILITLFLSSSVFAQVRPVETETDEKPKEVVKVGTDAGEQPKSQQYFRAKFPVKYQGGLLGYSKKEHGTIRFDEINERMIFFGKDGKEKFSIPYDSIVVVYPSQKKVRAGSGRVIGAAPVPGASILGSLVKKKKNYMIVQFDDPEVDAKGNANFLLDTEEVLTKAITALGENAEMKKRGDAYIRKKVF